MNAPKEPPVERFGEAMSILIIPVFVDSWKIQRQKHVNVFSNFRCRNDKADTADHRSFFDSISRLYSSRFR